MNSLPTIPCFPQVRSLRPPGALALLEQANKTPLESASIFAFDPAKSFVGIFPDVRDEFREKFQNIASSRNFQNRKNKWLARIETPKSAGSYTHPPLPADMTSFPEKTLRHTQTSGAATRITVLLERIREPQVPNRHSWLTGDEFVAAPQLKRWHRQN